MTTTVVLLTNEPRAYRETIAVALGMLCPDVTVIVAEPEQLDDYVVEYAPQVVLCSQLTQVVETQVPTWVVLYPDGSGAALVQIKGSRITMPNVELNGIVRLIAQADEIHDA